MKTTSQVATLTGVSVRTLQYYDEIGLLTPSVVTEAGYRLYDDTALEKLQQILFFKELGFHLKNIQEILSKPDFDKLEAYKQQKELLCMKRDRLNRLIALLEKLEKGENCMEFKEFDLTDYLDALEDFKNNHFDDVIKHWGTLENFNQFMQKVKENEATVAQIAIKQFGSLEKYIDAMKYNMDHFSEIMEKSKSLTENGDDLLQKSNALYQQLTADLTKDVSSPEVQDVVRQIVDFSKETTMGMDMGSGFWDMAIESYSDDAIRTITDSNYGTGASDYIAKALQYYFHKE